MSKKGEEKKDKEDKKSKKKDKKEKREIEFNLKDGVSWHDFVALIFIFFGFLWRIVRLVLAPIFWVYGENVRMIRFMRASGKDRTMTEDELLFVESMPFVITSTGLIGGILIGIFAAFSFSELIDDFIESINLNFIEGFFGIFATILGWIWAVFKFIIFGIGDIFGFVFNFFKDLFGGEPIFAFAVLVGIGIIGMIVWSVLAETGALERAYKVLKTVVVWVIGSPDRFRFRVDNYYRRFNHALTARLVGHGALMTRTHIFFKKVTTRTVFFSVYSFGAGIFIGITRSSVTTIEDQWRLVGLMSLVLFVAGIVAGTIFFGFMARFLDTMNRKKYVSPEFYTDDGAIDVDKISNLIEQDKVRRSKEREEFKKTLEEMKLIKRKPKSKKEKVDKKVKPKTTPKTEAPPTEETRSQGKSN